METMEVYRDEAEHVFANWLWTSAGILGCSLNLLLFVVVVLNRAKNKGFYKILTLEIAFVDFWCALCGIFLGTWYFQVDGILYCTGFGWSHIWDYWPWQANWLVWVITFYLELIIITYTFIWRAVLISNSRIIRIFENKLVFIPLVMISCGISYCDYAVDCTIQHVNLSPIETFQMLLPATLVGLHFIVIVSCALFIHFRIKQGTLSPKMKSSHKKRLFVLCIQSLNPFFLNFLCQLFYETSMLIRMPFFITRIIPFSCVHPALNALIILALTSEHRRFIANAMPFEIRRRAPAAATTSSRIVVSSTSPSNQRSTLSNQRL